jgi:hypothetical protein
MRTYFSRVILVLATIASITWANLAFAGTYTASRTGGSSAQLVISNSSSSNSVGIYWVDFDGNERFQRSLSTNSSYTQNTYLNHVFNIRDNTNGTLLTTVTMYSTYQQISVNPTSYNGYSTYGSNRATKIYFSNSSNISIDLYSLNPNGYETFTRTLRSGDYYTQDTYMNHVWIIRDSSRRELARTTSTNDYQTFTYSQNQPTNCYNNTSYYGYTNNSNCNYSNYSNYNNYANYQPSQNYYGDSWNNVTNAPVQYVYKKYTQDQWEEENYDYYEDDYYEVDNYSKKEACRLSNGTYDAGINMTISGRSMQFEVLGFKKSGSKITFRALETLTSGRTLTSRWSYNCSTGKATQL